MNEDPKSVEEFNSELILSWLIWTVKYSNGEKRDPPPGFDMLYADKPLKAENPYPWCTDDPRAWKIAVKDPDFRALKISVQEAKSLVPQKQMLKETPLSTAIDDLTYIVRGG